MKLVLPSEISKIDAFATAALNISEEELICRAGDAVAACVAKSVSLSEEILVLSGGGNNGADGYAAAISLSRRGYTVRAADVFDKGQRSEGGRAVLSAYKAALGEPLSLEEAMLTRPHAVIDAMFGTGFSGQAPERAVAAAKWVKEGGARVFAIDVPFGVDAAWGEVSEHALFAEETVVLSFMKRGLLSYPAREHLGRLSLSDIGLDIPAIHEAFVNLPLALDNEFVLEHMPHRTQNSHKGTYGRACLFVGSKEYRGAALLSAEAALRGGVGLLTVAAEKAVTDSVLLSLPEALYRDITPFTDFEEEDIACAVQVAEGASAVLVGCGCGCSAGLGALVRALLSREGAPVVLDADAINSLAMDRELSLSALKSARREVLLTPHPLELSRLSGVGVGEIQKKRMRFAADFAKKYGATLLLKGAGSVIADKEGGVFVNTTGSSALAKGGTGDVLSGVVTALLAQGATPTNALCIGAYLHGRAADVLEEEYTAYGVLPRELPAQIAKEFSKIVKSKE